LLLLLAGWVWFQARGAIAQAPCQAKDTQDAEDGRKKGEQEANRWRGAARSGERVVPQAADPGVQEAFIPGDASEQEQQGRAHAEQSVGERPQFGAR
jgi:hypothetical protein